jgi:quinol monooxygenase YgiN
MKVSIILKGKISSGKHETLRSLAKTLQQDFVLCEEGCEMYEFYIDGDNFVVLERWTDEASLDKHTKTPHFSEFVPKMKGQVEGGTFSVEIIKSSDRTFVAL